MKLLYKALFLCMFPFALFAQQSSLSIDGISGNENLPIETIAETMVVDQNTGTAILKGGVTITQGTITLKAEKVSLFSDPETNAFDRIEATGGVNFNTLSDSAQAQEAVYIVSKQTIEMRGNVILTKSNIEVSANKIDMDIKTGNAVLSGSVRTVLRTGTAQ